VRFPKAVRTIPWRSATTVALRWPSIKRAVKEFKIRGNTASGHAASKESQGLVEPLEARCPHQANFFHSFGDNY